MEKIPAFVDGSRQAETKQQLKAYANVLQKKKILIESFKTQYATLKNSLSYFPIVTTQVAEKASSTAANQTLANNLNIFLRDVLIYNLSSSEELAPKIKAQIESLLKSWDSYSAVERDNFDIAIAHAQIILNNKPQVDALTRELSLQPTLKRSEELYRIYSQYYQASSSPK